MNPSGLIGCFLTSALLSSIAVSKPLIQTKIIFGGEVSISEAKPRSHGQSIAVSGHRVPLISGFQLHQSSITAV